MLGIEITKMNRKRNPVSKKLLANEKADSLMDNYKTM